MAKNIMPGANRSFAAQHFGVEYKRAFDREKQRAADGVQESGTPVFASDIDKEALELAKFHAERAGVLDGIRFLRASVFDFTPVAGGCVYRHQSAVRAADGRAKGSGPAVQADGKSIF